VTRQSGALRIFLYNWPTYAGTWLGAAAVVALAAAIAPRLLWLAALGSGLAATWSAVSLLVSLYVYDRSELVSGAWVPRLLDPATRTWATVHAGLDAEVELDRVMPGRCVARLDIFDPRVMTSPSITRARGITAASREASRCEPTALALEDAACDAVVVAFTAHEIRDRSAREAFFDELRRSLRPGGKVLLVEHLRDLPNFAAFGPGYLHFVARSEWLRLAAHAKLAVAGETRITPFVMALTLQRPA
jgi:SAM-dependent methyltransferase